MKLTKSELEALEMDIGHMRRLGGVLHILPRGLIQNISI